MHEKKAILLVDDNAEDETLILCALKDHIVVVTRDGSEALDSRWPRPRRALRQPCS
jgi:hypothetical protein